MIRSSSYNYGFPASRDARLDAWAGAFMLHALAVAALVLGWPQARDLLDKIAPIEVRLLTPEKSPEPLPLPPSPQPKKTQPLFGPQLHPQPVAPSAPVEALPPPAVMTTASLVPSSYVVPPAPEIKPAPVAPQPVLAAPVHAAPVLQPEPLSEARFDADYLSNPKPPYPVASRRLGESGVVLLRVHVSSDGVADKVELKNSSGFPRLDEAARETVTRWHFVPARRGATHVAAWVVVPIVFSLN